VTNQSAVTREFHAGDTIADVMRGSCIALSQLEIRMLLCHVTQLSRVQLITQSERALTTTEAQTLSDFVQRRIAGEPIAYLIGEREFYGLSFHVDSAVLIPRPETELLVELALQHLPLKNARVLDMGTGSGAIAIAIAHTRPDVQVTALDVSEQALKVAQCNADRHDVRVTFLKSDWFSALSYQHFDVIVSNPPYIVAGDDHLSQGDLRFEPVDALTDHADGLSALRVLSKYAPRYLVPDGWLLMEHGYDQAQAVRTLLAAEQFSDVQSWCDLADIERVTGGRFTAQSAR
jgi:release factor glutamine methyltransferase